MNMELTIIGYFLCAVITVAVSIFLNAFYKQWNKMQKRHELYWLKVDCMIEALKKVNSGIGEKFALEYDRAYKFKTKDIDFINDN